MSIFVEQPHRRVRPMSGLGAFAQMLPKIRQTGMGAFLDADVCDYDALVQRVATQLGTSQEYVRRPQEAAAHAAVIAHKIWEQHCSNASDMQVTVATSPGWMAYPGDRRGHRDMVTHRSPSSHGAPRRAMRMKGLGAIVGAGLSRTGVVPASISTSMPPMVQQAATPQVVQRIQDQVANTVAPMIAAASASDGGGTFSSSPTSFSIEGSLPSGVAALLGGAVGLLVASMFVGGK